ncbi:MAG: hypothetical protein LW629_12375 [Burkholderiales bacterium]|nr:hypothetical protein [Burkholderiales bacterium]
MSPLQVFAHHTVLQGRDCFNRWGSDTALWVCGHQQISSDNNAHLAARIQALVVRLPDAVVVVDPGATYRQGRALARDLVRVFPAQRYWIVNSRAQADHVMGSDGLRKGLLRRGIPANRIGVLSGAVTQGLMSQRCPDCLQRLRRELGMRDMRGTEILIPLAASFTTPLEGDSSSGLVFSLTRELAFSEDLLVRHASGQWRWLGVLVDDRIPDLQHGSARDRLKFLKAVEADTQARWLFGSFGEVQQTQLAAQIQYFELLLNAASATLEGGADSIAALAALRKVQAWPLPLSDSEKRTHELNLQRLVRQAEEALF